MLMALKQPLEGHYLLGRDEADPGRLLNNKLYAQVEETIKMTYLSDYWTDDVCHPDYGQTLWKISAPVAVNSMWRVSF